MHVLPPEQRARVRKRDTIPIPIPRLPTNQSDNTQKQKKDHTQKQKRAKPSQDSHRVLQSNPISHHIIISILSLDRTRKVAPPPKAPQKKTLNNNYPPRIEKKKKETKNIIAETWRQFPPQSKRCLARDPACAPDLAIRSLRMKGGRVLPDQKRHCQKGFVWGRIDYR
jgi:hypothetical protein